MTIEEATDIWDLSKWSYQTLNRLCSDLRDIGVDAIVATEEGLKELDKLRQKDSTKLTKFGLSFPTKEFGLLEIRQSPIKWIHISHVNLGWMDSSDLGEYDKMEYWVSDSRRLPFPLGARPDYVRRHGRIIDIRWSVSGDGLSKRQRLELEQYLNDDKELKTTILSSKSLLARFHDVVLASWPWYGCWGICTEVGEKLAFPTPSIEEWRCCIRIATFLLKTPIPG